MIFYYKNKQSLSTIILQLIQNNGQMYCYEITKAVQEKRFGIGAKI
jgi:DNA-binding PadR family transcriptional regulator